MSDKLSPQYTGVYCESGVMKGSWESNVAVAAQFAHCWARARVPWTEEDSARSCGMWPKHRSRAVEAGHAHYAMARGGRRGIGRRKEGRRGRRRVKDFKTEGKEGGRTKYKHEVQRKIPYPLLQFVTGEDFQMGYLIWFHQEAHEKAQNEQWRGRDGKRGVQWRGERSWEELGAPCGLLAIPEAAPHCWVQTSAGLVRSQCGPFKKPNQLARKGLNHFKEVWTTQTKNNRASTWFFCPELLAAWQQLSSTLLSRFLKIFLSFFFSQKLYMFIVKNIESPDKPEEENKNPLWPYHQVESQLLF